MRGGGAKGQAPGGEGGTLRARPRPLRPRPSRVSARAPSSALAAEPPLPPDEWSRLLPGRDPAPPGAPAPSGEGAGPGEGGGSRRCRELAAGPGSRRPRLAGTAWGARRGHRGHGCRELGLVAGRGGGRSERCPGQGGGKEEGWQGTGTRAGLPGQRTPTRAAVPGPPRPGSGGGRPAPFVRVFQAGRLPPFPLPEFSFSVGEAPAQLEGEGVGEGVPGAGCPWPLRPDTPLPAPHSPPAGPDRTTSFRERVYM